MKNAEGVIGLSSPYKGTAERSSATKKPHKNEEIRRIFLGGFQHFYQIATKFNSSLSLVKKEMSCCLEIFGCKNIATLKMILSHYVLKY